MRRYTGRVLVLGEDTRSFLSVVRSLGRAGLEVHAAWCPFNAPAALSRYLTKIQRLPEVVAGDSIWLDGLIDLMRREQFDLVIPCNDAAVLLLQSNRERLEKEGRIYLLDDAAFETSFKKEKTYQLAQDLSIPVPMQRICSSIEEIEAVSEEWGFPLVLKPQSSASISNPFDRQSVQKIWSIRDILSALRSFRPDSGIQVQRNFIGKGVGVEVLSREGEVLTALQHERVHEPLMGGGSSYRKTVALDPDLLETTRRLMRSLRYTGVAMVEFKVNPVSGEWVLMEINGRFWGSLPLAIATGIDFPLYLYEMLLHGRTDFPQKYRTGIYCRNWSADLYWLRANLRADHSNPALMTVSTFQLLKEIGHVLTLRERSDTFVLDDPSPAYADLLRIIAHRMRRLKNKLPGERQSMRKAALRQFRDANTVLFVCKGNICRSPFAECLLRKIHPDIRSLSAGFYPVVGRPTPSVGVEAAQNFGVDLAGHRSQIVTPDLAAAADIIFIFDDEHRSAFAAKIPEVLPKVHFLAALNTSEELEIADPYGGSAEIFSATYQQIATLLTQLPTQKKKLGH